MNDGLDVGDRLNRAVGRDDKKYDGNSSMQHRGAEKIEVGGAHGHCRL